MRGNRSMVTIKASEIDGEIEIIAQGSSTGMLNLLKEVENRVREGSAGMDNTKELSIHDCYYRKNN